MGIENFEKQKNIIPFEKDFTDLASKEEQEKEKITALFQENAELSLLLASEKEIDMTNHQKNYYMGQLNRLRQEVKEVFEELRGVTGFEIPKELQGIKAADNYYKQIRKAA